MQINQGLPYQNMLAYILYLLCTNVYDYKTIQSAEILKIKLFFFIYRDVAFCSLNIDEVILEGTFSLYPNGTIVSIELTNEKFTIKNGATSKIILLKDVIGILNA